MKSTLLITVATLAFAVAIPNVASPQPADSTAAPTARSSGSQSNIKDKIYYGGNVTLSFGNSKRVGIFPLVAYKAMPNLSLGIKLGYEYVNYDVGGPSHNYGGGVFSRYRVVPQLYAHAEYQAVNYEIFSTETTSSRETVPFLLLGGGFSQLIAPRTWAYAEVLFDVLQDDKSPYKDWEPFVSFGVGVGF